MCVCVHIYICCLILMYCQYFYWSHRHHSSELGNLSLLIVHVDFTNNSFHGAIPQELARLSQLEFLSFQNNNFFGPFPSWFGSLSKLQTFILHGNQFSGSIPTAIFNLSALQAIDLRYNQLSGTCIYYYITRHFSIYN